MVQGNSGDASTTDSPATKARKLNTEQYDFLLYCEQQYWSTGRIPTYESMVQAGIRVNPDFVDYCYSHTTFLEGLKNRGIPLPGTSNSSKDTNVEVKYKSLTEQQFTVANVMLDVHDKRSKLKKLTEMGITTQQYNAWLHNPVYRQYCLSRAEDLLESAQPTAHLSLINRVEQGDLGAIKYFNELTGRFVPRSPGQNGVNVSISTGANLNMLGGDALIKIVEIVQTHVKDPEILDAIANDVLALTRSLTGSTQPETQPVVQGELTA